jgi:hypothetical protein
MQHPRLVSLLLPLLILGACTDQEPPTSPTAAAEPGPAFSHTAGHKVVTSRLARWHTHERAYE